MKIVTAGNKTKMVINQAEWTRIGKIAGWMSKTATAYINQSGMGMYEGREFDFGPKGKGKITAIDLPHKVIIVRMDSGEDRILDIDTLETVTDIEEHSRGRAAREEEMRLRPTRPAAPSGPSRNEMAKQRMNRLLDPNSDGFRLMGFLAARGAIRAQVPADGIERFERLFGEAKGRKPEAGEYEITNPESKWGHQLAVYIPRKSLTDEYRRLIGNFGMSMTQSRKEDTYNIYDTQYVLKLMEVGFEVGKPSRQNVDRIAANVEQEYGVAAREQFEEGFMSA